MPTYKKSLKEYLPAVLHHWWAVAISGIGGLIGLLDIITPLVMPAWVWMGIAVLGLVIAQFLAFHVIREARDVSDQRVRELGELNVPKLEIVFEKTNGEGSSSFHQIRVESGEDNHQILVDELYRVGIINMSARTIEDVRVWMNSFTPRGAPNLPFRLHVMNDNIPPYEESLNGFCVDPSDKPTRYVDVVRKIYIEQPDVPEKHILLEHVDPGVAKVIPDDRYEIILIATGRDVRESPSKTFVIFIDQNGRLQFEEASPAH